MLFDPLLFFTFFLRVVVAKPAFRGAVRVTPRLVCWKLAAECRSPSATMSERGIVILRTSLRLRFDECLSAPQLQSINRALDDEDE